MIQTQEAVAYTIRGAAVASGNPIQTVNHAIKSGELPATKSGRRWIVLREDLIEWLRRCKERGKIDAPISDNDRERLALLNRARRAELNRRRKAELDRLRKREAV